MSDAASLSIPIGGRERSMKGWGFPGMLLFLKMPQCKKLECLPQTLINTDEAGSGFEG